MTPCGPNNNFYSSAGTGMGMVTEAIMVELGEEIMIILLWWYEDDLPRLPEQGGGHREPGADPDQPPHQLAQGDILWLHGPLHKQVAGEDEALVTSIDYRTQEC